jgi:hypothetical protein
MVCTLANISVETYYSTSTFSFRVRYRTESIGNALSTQAPNLPLNPTLPGPSVGGGGLIFKLGFQPVRERALLAAHVCGAM